MSDCARAADMVGWPAVLGSTDSFRDAVDANDEVVTRSGKSDLS